MTFFSVLNLKFLDQLERRHCKDTPYFRPLTSGCQKGHFYEGFKYTTSGFCIISQLGFFLTINAPLILNVREVIFYASKTFNRQFQGGSGKSGGKKKVEAPLKNLEKSPIMCFASLQKITSQNIRISSALVFL